MNYDDEEYDPYAGFGGGGCSVHGEDYMRECSVCGMEFFTACFPHSSVCEECADQGRDRDEEDAFGDNDAEELKIVAELAPDDPELDKETEAALNSFGDPEDDETDAPPSDDILQAAEKSQAAVAREAAKARKAAAKPKAPAKPKAKTAAKAPAKAKKPSSKARK